MAKERGPRRNESPGSRQAPLRENRSTSLGHTPLEKVLERLQGVRRSGKGFIARCGAHEDKHPSLNVTEGRDGRVLLFCFAGCDTEAIVSAVGLTMSDLFADTGRVRPPTTPTRRRLYPVPRRVALALSERLEFPYEWELAKTLARVPEPLAQRDVLLSWDFLAARVNLPLVITLSRAAREAGA